MPAEALRHLPNADDFFDVFGQKLVQNSALVRLPFAMKRSHASEAKINVSANVFSYMGEKMSQPMC